MTINAVYREDAIGNDTATSFDYLFKIFAASHLDVRVKDSLGDETILTYPTHYSVTGVGRSAGGAVVLASVGGAWQNVDGTLKTGYSISIRRVVPVLQGTDIRNQGGFHADVHEDAFDYMTMIMQQHEDTLSRSIRLQPSYDPSDFDMELPAPLAGAALGWSATADSLVNIVALTGVAVSAFMATVLDDANAAAARATLGVSATGADTSYVLKSLVDAKGDIFVGTANDTVARKAVGAEGSLYADAAQADGLVWIMPPGTPCDFRLSLTTALAVPTADQTAKTTAYLTPYGGKSLLIYNGTAWVPLSTGELSQTNADTTKSPGAVGNSLNYDFFAWLDGATPRCTRGPDWVAGAGAGSAVARGTGAASTEIEYVDGRWVNKNAITNGPAARRGLYVGSMRSNGSAQFNDSAALRHVWNNYRRVLRPMANATETTDTWNYTTAAFRQANANTANQLDYLVGLAEDAIIAHAFGSHYSTNASGAKTGIGVDSTTVNSGQINNLQDPSGNNVRTYHSAHYVGVPGLGRHFLPWLEWAFGSGTATFNGDNGAGGVPFQTGIIGEVMA